MHGTHEQGRISGLLRRDIVPRWSAQRIAQLLLVGGGVLSAVPVFIFFAPLLDYVPLTTKHLGCFGHHWVNYVLLVRAGRVSSHPGGWRMYTLSVAVGEESGTLEEVHEPYLIMQGYLKRTPQGRVAMPKAYSKLGLKVPPGKSGGQAELFV